MISDDEAASLIMSVFPTHNMNTHTLTHKPVSLSPLPLFFCPSVGGDRDGHKKEGPVSGTENGPYCFTRDSGG